MTTLTRRSCFDRVGSYDESLYYEDWDMWLRIARHYDFVFSAKVSAKYRVVGTSMMRTGTGKMVEAANRVCAKHLRAGGMDAPTGQAAKDAFCGQAMLAYRLKAPHYRRHMLGAFRFSPSIGQGVACLFAWCGVDHGAYVSTRSRIIRLLGGKRARARERSRTRTEQEEAASERPVSDSLRH